MIYYVFDVNITVYVYRMEKHQFIGHAIILLIVLTQCNYCYKMVPNLILLIKYVITILMLLQCSNNMIVYLVYMYMYMYETCGHRHSTYVMYIVKVLFREIFSVQDIYCML